jgi:hypothetical protein
MFGEAIDRAFKGCAIGGIDRLEQAAGKFKGAGCEVAIDRAAGGGQ